MTVVELVSVEFAMLGLMYSWVEVCAVAIM